MLMLFIIVISKSVETKTNFKYLIGYSDKAIRPLVLILPETSGYVKTKSKLKLKMQSVSGRNRCLCCSSHALCYGRMRSCATHNSFASYDGNIICACCANKADCQ